MKWLAIAMGGALGAVLRAYVAQRLTPGSGQFPWATFSVNVGGCLLMGFLYVLITNRHVLPVSWQPFLLTGLLGALTTYSTFALEALTLSQGGRPTLAGFYALSTLLGCLTAVAAGAWAANRLAA